MSKHSQLAYYKPLTLHNAIILPTVVIWTSSLLFNSLPSWTRTQVKLALAASRPASRRYDSPDSLRESSTTESWLFPLSHRKSGGAILLLVCSNWQNRLALLFRFSGRAKLPPVWLKFRGSVLIAKQEDSRVRLEQCLLCMTFDPPIVQTKLLFHITAKQVKLAVLKFPSCPSTKAGIIIQ